MTEQDRDQLARLLRQARVTQSLIEQMEVPGIPWLRMDCAGCGDHIKTVEGSPGMPERKALGYCASCCRANGIVR